jgi:hypothetical protein
MVIAGVVIAGGQDLAGIMAGTVAIIIMVAIVVDVEAAADITGGKQTKHKTLKGHIRYDAAPFK